MAIVAALAALLGPPLGELLTADPGANTFFPQFAQFVRPEGTEQARYLVALSLPLLIALAIVLSPRWLPQPAPRWTGLAVTAVQALLAGLLVACYVAQVNRTFGTAYTTGAPGEPPFGVRYFTTPTLIAAALVAGATLFVLRREQLRETAAGLLRETRERRIAGLLLAVLLTAIWMLHAVQSDATVYSAAPEVRFHLRFTLDETFAVLNGMSPLVDYSAQYSSLWPYLSAVVLLVFGKTALAYSLTMCVLTGLALLAIFGVLRRVTRSTLAALLLYAPFLATSVFMLTGTPANRSSVGTFYGTFPLRYALPYLLALLTARQIDRDGGVKGTALLFLVGGLAILNNADFGFAALGATVAALLWTLPGRPHPPLRRLAAAAAGGLLAALALVSLLTLVRAGELPHLWRLFDYARLFTAAGFAMLPLPGILGVQLVIYLTYVAAIAVATVRALRHATDRVLTGMLAWSGVFGLGSAAYFVGRSHPNALKTTFSVWALALVLLTVVVVRHLRANPQRRPTIAAVAVLFGMGLATCSLAQVPTPWSQIDRLDGPHAISEEIRAQPLVPPTAPRLREFIASIADGPSRFVVREGAPVAILLTTGHRIADANGIRNVSEYTGADSMPTVERLERVLDALRRAGGNTVIVPNPVDTGVFDVLERRGFGLLTRDGPRPYDPGRRLAEQGAIQVRWAYDHALKWVDTKHLHAEALR